MESVAQMNCPQCKAVLQDDARFCNRCGLSMTYAETPAGDSAALKPTRIADGDAPTQIAIPALADPHIGTVLESRYKLLARLGEGGMGAVYRARRVLIGDEVAVKILHRDYVKAPPAL